MSRCYTIILYIRISVEDEDNEAGIKDESNSVSNQRDLLRQYVKNHTEFKGCNVVELCDDGFSGTNMNRPSMQRLLAMSKAKEIDCIIVKDFSRFGRDYVTVSDYVDQIFPFLGIRFIAVNEGYDSAKMNGATSGVDIAFRNVIYDFYSRDISMKVRSGKLTKAKNGAYLSAFAPIGYKKDKADKNRLIIDPDTVEVVRRIFSMAGMGMSASEIARLFNAEKVPTPSQYKRQQGYSHKWWIGIEGVDLWNTDVIIRILRDERYLGKAVYGKRFRPKVGDPRTKKVSRNEWIVVEQRHEPIISEQDFQAAQASLAKLVEINTPVRGVHLFTQKVRCGMCGHMLARKASPTPRFFCTTRYVSTEYSCMSGHVKESDLADVVLMSIHAYIRVLLQKKDLLEKNSGTQRIKLLQHQLGVYRTSYSRIDEQKAELYDALADEKIDREQFLRQREQLSQRQNEIGRQIETLEEEHSELNRQLLEAQQNTPMLRKYLQMDQLTRAMVEEFVDCIHVYSDKSIHIDWRFDKISGDGINEKQSIYLLPGSESRSAVFGEPKAAPYSVFQRA